VPVNPLLLSVILVKYLNSLNFVIVVFLASETDVTAAA
jgi:hypothetical protein